VSQRAILAYLGLACVIGAITAGEVDILGVKIGQVLEIKRQFLIAGLGILVLLTAAAWDVLCQHWRWLLPVLLILLVTWALTAKSMTGTWYIHEVHRSSFDSPLRHRTFQLRYHGIRL
jgi:hypothetical protein